MRTAAESAAPRWAITAAVARSVAGAWSFSATPAEAARPPVLPLHWPTRLAMNVADQPGEFRFARLPSPLKNDVTPDRACNLALDLADDLRVAAPWLARLPASEVGCSITVSKGAIGPLADALSLRPATRSAEHWQVLLQVQGPEAASNFVAERLNLQGPRLSPLAACATGVANLACGGRLLSTGGLAAVLCGGAESSLHPLVAASMRSMGILDTAPMRPFDSRRSGFNLGEGGGLLLMEPAPSSTRRPLAWLTGARLYGDAHHMTDLHDRRQTITRVLRDLLQSRYRSDISAHATSRTAAASQPIRKLYINAHATATKLNDPWETVQLIEAFGPAGWARREGWLDPSAHVVISGTKSMTGHLLGASASLEAVVCVAVLNGAPPPPTLNLIEPHDPWPEVLRSFDRLHLLTDPATGRDDCARAEPKRPFDAALSLNYGFGGHVGGILLESAAP